MRHEIGLLNVALCEIPVTRWFKYDRDYLCVNKSQFVPVIFEPPCILSSGALLQYLVTERNRIPKSLATLLIALMARRTVSGAMFALSDFLLCHLGITEVPKTKFKLRK
jgi:hypothetical protein